jgi:hypothetical protein
MPSNIDIQKVVRTLDESKLMNLDLTLRDIVASPTADLIGSVAHLEPWELICYTWVTLIRRRAFDEITLPVGKLAGELREIGREVQR